MRQNKKITIRGFWMLLVFDLIFFILQPVQASGKNTLLIGLDADMSSGSAQAGVAIERGALISIEEINQKGGVVGHFLKQVVNVCKRHRQHQRAW